MRSAGCVVLLLVLLASVSLWHAPAQAGRHCRRRVGCPTTSTLFETTTTVPTTTTSTTLPPCSAATCDDGDPCTADVCALAGCRHDDLAGIDAVRCAFEGRGLEPALCGIPRAITHRLNRARRLVEHAAARPDASEGRRLVRRALRLLDRTAALAARREARQGSGDCGRSLVLLIRNAQARAARWLLDATPAR